MKNFILAVQVTAIFIWHLITKNAKLLWWWIKYPFGIRHIKFSAKPTYVGETFIREISLYVCHKDHNNLLRIDLYLNRDRDGFRPGGKHNNPHYMLKYNDGSYEKRTLADWRYYSYYFSFKIALLNSNRDYSRVLQNNPMGNVSARIFSFHLRDFKNSMYYWEKSFKKLIGIRYEIFKAIKLSEEIAASHISQMLCLSDPMNGCPGDFAESFSRSNAREEQKYEDLKVPKYIKDTLWMHFHKIEDAKLKDNLPPWLDDEDYGFADEGKLIYND